MKHIYGEGGFEDAFKKLLNELIKDLKKYRHSRNSWLYLFFHNPELTAKRVDLAKDLEKKAKSYLTKFKYKNPTQDDAQRFVNILEKNIATNEAHTQQYGRGYDDTTLQLITDSLGTFQEHLMTYSVDLEGIIDRCSQNSRSKSINAKPRPSAKENPIDSSHSPQSRCFIS